MMSALPMRRPETGVDEVVGPEPSRGWRRRRASPRQDWVSSSRSSAASFAGEGGGCEEKGRTKAMAHGSSDHLMAPRLHRGAGDVTLPARDSMEQEATLDEEQLLEIYWPLRLTYGLVPLLAGSISTWESRRLGQLREPLAGGDPAGVGGNADARGGHRGVIVGLAVSARLTPSAPWWRWCGWCDRAPAAAGASSTCVRDLARAVGAYPSPDGRKARRGASPRTAAVPAHPRPSRCMETLSVELHLLGFGPRRSPALGRPVGPGSVTGSRAGKQRFDS